MRRFLALTTTTAALLALPLGASAQAVLVRVLDDAASTPVFGALAHLVDPGGETVRSTLTDERGRALFVGISAASYRVRVEMIGMATTESELFDVPSGGSITQELRLESSAIQLEGIQVEADERCRLRPDGEGLAIADVWDEARKALTAAALTDEQGIYRYETMVYNRRLDRDMTILSEEESRRAGYMLTPFESLPAEELVRGGFVQSEGRESVYYAPDADVLLSDAFLDTHCFRLVRPNDRETEVLGLAFQPTGDNRRVPDIRGTLWLDEQTAELRWLEFTYENVDPDLRSSDVGGRVDFRRMPAGTWIVPEWWIRMPAVAERRDQLGRPQRSIDGYLQTGGLVLEVREAGGRSLGQRVETGAIEGVVLDSLGMIRQGARVGVVGSNQEVFTDGEGRFSITGLRPGRYRLQFVDPHLEQYGFIPPPVVRDVIRGEATELDYHMPSIGDVLFEECRGEGRASGPAMLAGMVRDERGMPVPGATVRIQWNQYRLRRSMETEQARIDGVDMSGLETAADGRGFYRFCSVPTDMLIYLTGARSERQSDTYEVRIGLDIPAALQSIVIRPDPNR